MDIGTSDTGFDVANSADTNVAIPDTSDTALSAADTGDTADADTAIVDAADVARTADAVDVADAVDTADGYSKGPPASCPKIPPGTPNVETSNLCSPCPALVGNEVDRVNHCIYAGSRFFMACAPVVGGDDVVTCYVSNKGLIVLAGVDFGDISEEGWKKCDATLWKTVQSYPDCH